MDDQEYKCCMCGKKAECAEEYATFGAFFGCTGTDFRFYCSMFIKTDNDREIKQCLETWFQKICDNISVPSVIKGYSKNNGDLMPEEIKCTKTFISNLKEDSMCGEKYIDFTFMCEDMIEEKE